MRSASTSPRSRGSRTLEEITEDHAAFWRSLSCESQLRWLGPEKGVIHLSMAAVVNAVWDLHAKREAKPVWKLLADMAPRELVRCIDFRYITDAMTPDEAIDILERQAATKPEREARLRCEGYPAYTTSAGWMGYPDAELRRLCREALADGWTHFKVKVGAAPVESPLARPKDVGGVRVGNRFCVLPMEGWDGTPEGAPSELTRRRWQRFGASGAKLIWGGEAVAVRHDGRANPNQLLLSPATQSAIARLRADLVAAHRDRFGANADGDLYVGLQLAHSGRYARPSAQDRPEPLAAYHHPLLDRRLPAGVRVLTDAELDALVDDFVRAAALASAAGFAFVDIKHCHGYLGHELLSARTRPGRYGGPIENRTRFLRSIVEGIRAEVPGLAIAVRLSAFDTVPYRKDAAGAGVPEDAAGVPAFGLLRGTDMADALEDARAFLRELERLDVRLVCITAGSPYYNPHVQRPALFPPSDGYAPPEDPLVGVARQIDATARLKREFPSLVFVGSAYSYLQEWLPHVAQHAVACGLTDFVGLGRMILAYPDLPADVLAGRPLRRDAICRTFSDCTTGPRLGLVSGCYPLDPFYTQHHDAAILKAHKPAESE